MSDLIARRWFATKEARGRSRRDLAAFEWDDDPPIAVLYSGTERVRGRLRTVWRLACWRRLDPDNAAENAMPTPVDVTDRSLAHVDRLARDFIGHGVTPTTRAGRGVCSDADAAPRADCIGVPEGHEHLYRVLSVGRGKATGRRIPRRFRPRHLARRSR